MFARSYRTARRETYELFAPRLGGRLGFFVDWGIMALIAVNVTAVIFGTVESLATAYSGFFYWFEVASVGVFTVEYASRVWSSVEAAEFDQPVRGRLRFAVQPLLLVDLLAIAPFYLAAAGLGLDLRVLRSLRLLRIFRLLKLARYSTALQTFSIVLIDKKEKLVIAMFANGLLLVIASSLMYTLETGAQPNAFSSIPATMWWGVATLSTVGYGDVHPVTAGGKAVGSIVAMLGVGMFALPASILASGFMEAAEDEDEVAFCPNCGEALEDHR